MKGELKHKVVNNFDKGENTYIAPHLLKAGSSPRMIDCSLQQTGSVSKLKGDVLLGTVQADFAAGIRNLGLYKGAKGESLVANGGQKVKYYDGSDFVDIPNLTAIIAGNADQRFSYLMWQDQLLFMSQFLYMSWDGSGNAVDLTSSLSNLGDIMMLDGSTDQLFVAGNDDNPSTVYISDTSDYTNFTSGTYALEKIYDKDGSRITGMVSMLGTRYIIKSNKIVRMDLDFSGATVVRRKTITDPLYGAIGKDAWCYGNDGVYMFTGSQVRVFGQFRNYTLEKSIDAGLNVQPTIIADMNTDYLEDVKMSFYDDKIIMSYVSVAQTTKVFDKQLVWDLKLPSKGVPVSVGAWTFDMEAQFSADRELYFASSTTGAIYQLDGSYNRHGEAIHAIYDTIADSLNGDPQSFKTLRYLEYEFSNIIGSVDITIEGQTNAGVPISSTTFRIGTTPQTGLWNQNLWNVVQYNLVVGGIDVPDYIRDRQSIAPITAQTFKVTVENAIIDESFTLSSLGYLFIESAKRRYNPNYVI